MMQVMCFRGENKRTLRHRDAGYYTLLELLIVISTIAILVALLLPALGKARARGQEIQCMNNLGELGKAYWQYQEDYRWLPRAYTDDTDGTRTFWYDRLKLGGDPELGISHRGYWLPTGCPTVRRKHGANKLTYGQNILINDPRRGGPYNWFAEGVAPVIRRIEDVRRGSETVFCGEAPWQEAGKWFTSNVGMGVTCPDAEHRTGSFFVFFDNHVAFESRFRYAAADSDRIDSEFKAVFWTGKIR